MAADDNGAEPESERQHVNRGEQRGDDHDAIYPTRACTRNTFRVALKKFVITRSISLLALSPSPTSQGQDSQKLEQERHRQISRVRSRLDERPRNAAMHSGDCRPTPSGRQA